MTLATVCECSRHQLQQVGCDCGADQPYDFDRADLQAEAESENAWIDRERAEAAAEAAYWTRLWLQDAAATYQTGW